MGEGSLQAGSEVPGLSLGPPARTFVARPNGFPTMNSSLIRYSSRKLPFLSLKGLTRE